MLHIFAYLLLAGVSLLGQNAPVDQRVRAFVPLLNPRPESQPRAVYPDAAQGSKVRAVVELLVTIDPRGTVVLAEVLSGPQVFRQAALDAVKRWSYRPVLREQAPVYAMTTATVNFVPPDGSGSWAPRSIDEVRASEARKAELRRAFPRSPEQILADFEQDCEGDTGQIRFYRLNDLAKAAFKAGAMAKAESYAKELLGTASQYPSDWNYGNALNTGNIVRGRIALQGGNKAEAKRYLLEAGKVKGSPQLNSFGPNMSLAKDLLEAGERDAVLEYFELCRTFWKMGDSKLSDWAALVRGGRMPEFGANLEY